MTKTHFMKISERALIGRINRKLAHQNEVLRKSRSKIGYNELGDYYILDFNRGFIVAKDVDLKELAVELNCLDKKGKVEISN